MQRESRMAAITTLQRIRREPNAAGVLTAYISFVIRSNGGYAQGEIGVPDASDGAVLIEVKRSLRDLLPGALVSLNADSLGPVGSPADQPSSEP